MIKACRQLVLTRFMATHSPGHRKGVRAVPCLALVFLTLFVRAAAAGDAPSLIPRKVLFAEADKSQVQLSPDGQMLAYLAHTNDAIRLCLAPAREPGKAVPVTPQKAGPIFSYRWTYRPAMIVYTAPAAGG